MTDSVICLESVRAMELECDPAKDEEDRFIAVGPIRRGIVVVVFTERQDDVIRMISARIATGREARLFRLQLQFLSLVLMAHCQL